MKKIPVPKTREEFINAAADAVISAPTEEVTSSPSTLHVPTAKRQSSTPQKVGFNLQMPVELDARLRDYVDNYARRYESMTYIILTALEAELDRREAAERR